MTSRLQRRLTACAAVLALGCQAALAQSLITSVELVEGWDGIELPPYYTGQTFDHPDEGAGFTVPRFGEEAPAFNDRTHEWNGASAELPLPSYLVGGEYIMFPNDDRDNDPYVVEVTVSAPALLYLLIDNRLGGSPNTTPPALDVAMLWVLENGWEPVLNGLNRAGDPTLPDEVGVDESGDGVGPGVAINQWSSVYVRRVNAGTFTLHTPENAGQNMYGVVVQPVPTAPFVSGASGDLLGVVFEITDGENSALDPDTIRVTVDGTDVTSELQISSEDLVTRIRYRMDEPFPSESSHTAVLEFADDAAPAKEVSYELPFTVEYYATLGADHSVPADSVDTGASGFTVRVVQARDTVSWPGPDLPNNTTRGELHLAGLLRDPVSGGRLENVAEPGPGEGGTYRVEVINWNQEMNDGGTGVEIGVFQSTTTPALADEPIPGIGQIDPDTGSHNLDNIAAEVVGYLDLPAGVHRFGVNSDDGFRVTAGRDPHAPSNVVLGEFSGGRGSASTFFHVYVTEPGIYPVRLIWYEGGGGANLEFFSVHQPDPDGEATYVPVNGDGANAFRSYAASAAVLPAAAAVHPFAGSTGALADAAIRVALLPRGAAADPDSVELTVNGESVAATVDTDGDTVYVEYVPAGLWPSGSTNLVELTYGGSGVDPVTVSWSFVVEDYSGLPVIPASFAVPANSVSGSGFRVDVYQMTDPVQFLPLARSGFADNNSVEAAEMQISRGYIDPDTGAPYENFSAPGENDDGTHNVEIINWNQQYANAGDFNLDNGFEDALAPGLWLDGDVAENNWITAEALTYLELGRGRYRFGVNSDDGFKVSAAPNPGDVVGVQLGLFSGGRGAANTFFDFIVEEDGIYPFRLLWWEGTGGASVEFKSQDAVQLSQTLINDRNRSEGITAYRTYTGPAIPRIASVSPFPGSTDVAVDAPIEVGLENLGNATVTLRVNGQEVTTERTTQGDITTLRYEPASPFPPDSTVIVDLVRGATTTSWSYQVGQGAGNLVTVEITEPADGSRIPEGPADVTLAASAEATGAEIVRVEFFDGGGGSLGAATSAPFEVEWRGVLPGRYTIVAVATDDRGLTAESTPVALQVGEPIGINFQAATAEVPEGYLPDYGDVFDDRGDGYSYGWDNDNTAAARDRNNPASPDERYDTLNHWQSGATTARLWEIELPNGWYNVFIVAGDPSNFDSVYDVTAEGVTIVRGTPSDGVRFFEGMGAVEVTDGRLSIGNGPTASNNKVAFLEIYEIPPPEDRPVIAAPEIADGMLTVTWAGGGTLEWAPSVTGPWTSTGDSDGSYTEPASEETRFFRVAR